MYSRKQFAVWVIMILAFALIVSPAIGAEVEFERIEGDNRFETAVEISKKGWSSSDTIVITTGGNFPDALAGAPLAYQHDAPILMSNKGKLPSATITEINRLGATNAIVLGGEAAISLSVVSELESLGLEVNRIFGANRSETAINISAELGSYDTAILVDGNNFPDALAVAPYAARHGIPIFLTETNSITEDTKSALSMADTVYVIGGEKAVNSSIFNSLDNATRISGANRYETAAEVITTLGMDVSRSYVATGSDFADALTGSVLAAKNNAPILLVAQDHVPEHIQPFLSSIDETFVLGGVNAVGPEVANQFGGQESPPGDDLDVISMGMTKAEVKSIEEKAGATLVDEDSNTLVYMGSYLYGLEIGIVYSFTNDHLDEMAYVFLGTEDLSIEDLEALFQYLLNEIEYEFGEADYVNLDWPNNDPYNALEALWLDNNERPSDIYLQVIVDGDDDAGSAIILLTIK